MSIKIRLPADFRKYANNEEIVEVNGHTTGESLQDLFRQCTRFKEGMPVTGFVIHVGKERAYSWESDRPVKDGDELLISLLSGCC